MQRVSSRIVNPTSLPHDIFNKFKKKFVTEKNTPVKDKNNENMNIFKKNKFKKTIIIDDEGNNNLNININNRFSIKNKMPFLNVKHDIKPYAQINRTRNSMRIRNRNYAIKSLNNHFKNCKNSDTITSSFTETNSLFMNSNSNINKKPNNEVIGKEDNKYRVNEYNKIIDILKVNITDVQKMLNEKRSHLEIKDVIDYNTFVNNVEKFKSTDKMVNISNSISNYNYIKESTNDLISFLESSFKDEFYQTLLMAKVKNKNSNDDSFNLSQSTSEFENISKGFEEEKCNFDNNIQIPNKNDIKIFTINSLNKLLNENRNKKDKLCDYNIKGNMNETRNDVCIIF